MAKLIYIKDVFSKEREECEVAAGKTLGEIAREKCQGTRMVEAYNARTGETFSKPAEVKLAISVNDKIVNDLSYQVKEDDNIVIAAVPGASTVLSIIALVSIAVVAIIGLVTMKNMGIDDSGGKQKSALELENLPDVRGSKNQSIRDKRVPMVFGRHLVTPLVAGEGWNRIPFGTEIEPEKVLTNVNVSWVETNGKEIQGSTGYNYSVKAAFTRYTGHIEVSLTRMPTHPFTVNVHVAYCSAEFIKTAASWEGRPGYSQRIGATIRVSTSAMSKDITVTIPAFSTSASSGDITSDCSAGIPAITGISVEGGEDALWKETKGSVKCEVVARTDAGREKIHGYTGKDCYARFLYCAGYAPLKLTEIKLGELMLSHNGGDGSNRPVMHGMLSGCDLEEDKGDILRKWKENEIRMEILQKGSRSELYPQKIKQDTIDANILHVVEGEIDEISQYKGTKFPSGYRTNSIRYTQSCPMAIEVELQAPQGLYRQRTHMDGGSEVRYYPLSCWVAIQWRPHYADTKSADAEGAGVQEGWRTFTSVNSVPHRAFTEAEKQADKDCHAGTEWPQKDTYNGWIGAEAFNLSDCQQKDGVIDGNGRLLDKGVSEARFIARYDMTWEDIKLLCGKGDTKPDLDSVEVRAVRISPSYVNEQSGGTTWGPWTYNDVVKWSYLRSEIFDKDKALEVIKSGDSNGWQEKIMMSSVPDEDWNRYCFVAIEVKADSVEIKGELDKINMVGECLAPTFNPRTGEWSATSEELTDHLVWDGENWQKCIDADTSDGSVAWRKARADWVLGGRKGKAPRTARAGATLFGNSGRLGVIQQAIFTNASFNTDRQRWYLTEENEARFVTANPASMYLLAMCGPHLGVEAKGYNRINMASVEALWEWSRHVTDGYMEDGKLREMEFTVNGYLTDEVKESELVARVLTAARSFQTIDDEGRYMVVIDKKRDWAVMQINQENALELSNSRSFGKDVSGLKVTFTDENDGWQKNIIYAMADGESIEVHTGDIEDKKFDWVTDPVQAWSLARYELARKLQQKEVITRTLGMAGMSVRLGDLVEVSDTTLLIGDGTGRINGFIQDDEWLYGFTVDGHFECVFQADGSCKQGVSVTRISNHGRARVMTLALAGERGVIDKDGHVRGTDAGMTSTAILAEPISLKTGLAKDAPEGGAEFRPKIGDIAAFGDIGKITSEYVVGKIEPQDEFKFRLTLWQYSPLMYEYGAALPSFQSNMSIPDRSSDGLELELGPSWNDLANAQAGTISTLQQWVEGQLHGDDYEPGPAEVTLARAEKEGIVVTCTPDVNVGMRNTPKTVHWQMQGWDKAGNAAAWDSEGVESGYMFDRARDGYPEAEELYSVKIRCRVTNIYGKTGAWSEWKTVDADDYGTWIPQAPRVRVKTDNRAVLMTVEQPFRSDGRKLYGDVVNSVLVRREDPTRDPMYALDSNGNRVLRDGKYVMTDSDYKGSGERQYFKPVTGASYADGVDNYKDGIGDHNDKDKRVDCYDEYRQIMPLAGQGFAGYSRREEWTPRGADAPTGSMTYLQVNEHDILNDEEHGVPDDVQIKPPSTEYDPYPCSTFSNGADMAGGSYDADYGRLCKAEFGDTGYRVKFTPLMLQVRDKNGETGYLAIERNIAALFFAREGS